VRALRCERGGVLALSALIIPGFLILTALVLDAGTWYTHKRSLQNRADAGALAAGVEYLSQLANCVANPAGPAATAIADKARLYAGATGTDYNAAVNKQSEVTVKINATSPTAADASDGGNPCEDHAPDGISPSGGIWTDVITRETNIGTLAGMFGINLPSIAARARVALTPIIGLQANGLPFVAETGDSIECVWAQFVRARDGSTTQGFTVLPSNPIELTKVAGTSGTWTGSVDHVFFTNASDDVAIQYWAGSKDGNASCNWSTSPKKPLPHKLSADNQPVAVDWLNVYDTGAAPTADTAPKLRRFALVSDTCGGPGFLYTASTDPSIQCRVGFQAEIDTGVNRVRGTITVNPVGTGVDPITVPFDNTSAALTTATGTILINPNELVSPPASNPTLIQDYDQVGPTYFSVSWEQTSGRVGSGGAGNCASGGNNCKGTFQGETAGGSPTVQQMAYVADPLASVPLTATSTSLTTTSFPALSQTGPFTISFTHTALDKEHVVLIRDSGSFGPGTGNRTRSIYCGNSPGGGAAALQNGIEQGCAKDLVVNTRGDLCSPAPGSGTNPWDCVQLEQGQKTAVSKGAENRFTCTLNNWPNPPDGDQRWAYIILTEFGRTAGAANGSWLPISGLLRVYVTGWDRQGGGGGPSSCAYNDDPPRGYDGQGAQVWGHLVSPITLDSDVIVDDGKCNLALQNLQCKPALVR
jgi:Putative Flp pilus-assembly TadE/G-like